MSRDQHTTYRRYCKCGGYITFRGTEESWYGWLSGWLDRHTGDGHEPATAAEWRRVRRKHKLRALHADNERTTP